ncbi:MAG: (deoxy)nucleoside triphosphate pyrophosphohydrolase [Alphaproteobacteria bacterium]|nr:(deoxy)nucleoside triphosphate pyrophosphohydrolase [Alphaproteobacteria bacterium]
MKTILVSAVALVDLDGRVLLASRPKGKHLEGMYEFPGGKVEEGESPEAALIRELKEELDINVAESCLSPFTFVTHKYDEKFILLMLYLCRKWQGEVTPLEGQHLIWKTPNAMRDIPMPPADVPLVAMLRDFL